MSKRKPTMKASLWRRLTWTLFDGYIDDPLREWGKAPLRTRLHLAFPSLYYVGVHRLPCGCSQRRWTGHLLLIGWHCPLHGSDEE